MKSLFIFLLFGPVIIYAQNKLDYFDQKEHLNTIIEKFSSEAYDEALELIDRVDINDSIYATCYYLKTSIYFKQEKYEQVIELAEKIEPFSTHDASIRINKGISIMRLGRYQECKDYFDSVVAVYPCNYLAVFNRGIASLNLKDYPSAIKDFEQSIILNPFFIKSHLELGRICYTEHRIAQAMLCFNTCLLIHSGAEESLNILTHLNTIVAEKNESEPNNITISEDDEAFAEIDLMINNYMALNDKYKVSTDIRANVVKQNHLLMEMLQNFEGNGGFWEKKYVPFYREIYSSGNFDSFMYHIMASTTNEDFIKILKKHQKDVDNFIKWAGALWVKLIRMDNPYKGESNYDYSYYNDGEISAIGKEDEEGNFVGECAFFFEDGNVKVVGQYANGKKNGEWKWYHPNGKISEIINYTNGEVEGKYMKFSRLGYLVEESEYSKDLLNGTQKKYSDYGVLVEKNTYLNGKSNGMGYLYHDLGEGFVRTEVPLKEDKIDGMARKYYSNGQEELVVEFANEKQVGEELNYYPNGHLNAKYTYVDGEINGPCKRFTDTGKLLEEGNYTNGFKTGEWKTYYTTGVVESIIHYNDKGRFHGTYEEFTIEGKKVSLFEYNNGKFISYEVFRPDGRLIKKISSNNKDYRIELYYSNANMKSAGLYNNSDGKEGEWRYHNYYGELTSKENYQNGLLEGNYTSYYSGQSVKNTEKYKMDKVNGESKYFFIDGKLKSHGYYADGKLERYWQTYYDDGSLSTKSYFQHDIKQGYQYEYSVEGRLITKDYYDKGKLISTVDYDTNGKFLNRIDYYTDSLVTLKFPNGRTRQIFHIKSGVSHGEIKWYFLNGQLETQGQLFDGRKEGSWIWFFDDGTKNSEGIYQFGNQEGEWITYYKNGKISARKNYLRDELHGLYTSYTEEGIIDFEANYYEGDIVKESKNYSKKGELQLVRYYDYGSIIGYSYPDKDGNLIPMIPIKNGTGKVLTYYSSGAKAREFEMVMGVLHGDYSIYHSDGKLASKSTYFYGNEEGMSEDYFSNGQLKLKVNFHNDEKTGESVEYYSSGQLKQRQYYKFGMLTGWSEYYSEKGDVQKKEFYINGMVYDAVYYK